VSVTTSRTTETIDLEIAGKPVHFVFTSAIGLRPFVEAVLTGADGAVLHVSHDGHIW